MLFFKKKLMHSDHLSTMDSLTKKLKKHGHTAHDLHLYQWWMKISQLSGWTTRASPMTRRLDQAVKWYSKSHEKEDVIDRLANLNKLQAAIIEWKKQRGPASQRYDAVCHLQKTIEAKIQKENDLIESLHFASQNRRLSRERMMNEDSKQQFEKTFLDYVEDKDADVHTEKPEKYPLPSIRRCYNLAIFLIQPFLCDIDFSTLMDSVGLLFGS